MEKSFIGNTVVLIPCYEPSEKDFVPYAKSLIDAGIKRLVVVNDGSGQKYSSVFRAVEEYGATVLSYDENYGKGHALKYGFEYCKDNFDSKTIFVTADCDGQHSVKDVFRVAEVAWNKNASFVLGSRDFADPSVPARSRNGNVWTRRAYRILYGVKLNDTQTGLRAFGYSFLDEFVKIPGERFEYEMKQLIVLHKNGVDITEVPIETIYREKSEDVEKVSHYRVFRDSVRVLAVLLTSVGWYALSGVISALLDMLSFGIFYGFVYNGMDAALRTLLATVTARVISSIFNSVFNFKVVFKGKSASCFVRYYVLWTVQLAASFGIAKFWDLFVSSTVWLTLLKGLCDMLVAVLSYQVQVHWVFRERRTRTKFFGPFARFCGFFMNLFMRPNYSSEVSIPETGVVYVCRHLNMHGPLTIVRKLGFDTHLMVFSPFFSFKTAYNHYSRITYARNGKPTAGGKIKAFFAAFFVPKIMKSTQAVPVYRKNARAVTTLRLSIRYLEKGESVCVFPDIDYKAGEEEDSDIYEGFLVLEKMYYKRTGKHLAFIPLFLDEKNKRISERSPIYFPSEEDFSVELPAVSKKIKEGISCEKETHSDAAD